jgi:two-component system, NtrC family, sensor kinase
MMNIRPKVVALVAGLFSTLILTEIVIQERIVMPSFSELERADARTSMTRVDYALARTLEGLESTTSDWSDWGELYQYMQHGDRAFLDTYTTPVAMAPLKVNMLLLVNTDGGVIFSAARDLDSNAPLSIDVAQQHSLPKDFPWRRVLTGGRSVRGLVSSDHGIMMLAGAPILDGSGTGQSVGMVLMGRLLTPAQLQEIGTQAQATLVMIDTPRTAPAQTLVEVGNLTQIYRAYQDIYGRPLMTLQVDVPRNITAQGHAAIVYSTLYLVGAAITILVLLLIILNRVVLIRLARVTRHAVAVGNGKDLTARLDFMGADEIGRLALEFDRMVERVAQSRRLLVDQSFQAGFAELAKGIMHNLGNAMTPLGVRLSLLTERLRGAPIIDVRAAITELAMDPAQTQRGNDLAQFIKLGYEQIEAAIEGVFADVAVMERQASIVTATLAEQMASARNEQVLESIRLPELLAQTLDIVPDVCRRRLVVEADDSLNAVGAVTVARTVLRLVLQNLIINAADAVHAAGLTQGALRLTAEIERDHDRQQLHLLCQDNGIGIAPEHLRRLFDKGFSTKSQSTNQGIGLHWCANALRSLGGRIWAVSDGPGHGASLHVLFPVSREGDLSYGR